jgi:hypothetical protein
MAQTAWGRKIDLSDRQFKNTKSWISLSFDPGSKVNDLSNEISERAFSESRVSDAGRQSDSRTIHPEKASRSIVSRLDSDSKTTEHKLEQEEKQQIFSIRTVLGITIDFSEVQLRNAPSSI